MFLGVKVANFCQEVLNPQVLISGVYCSSYDLEYTEQSRFMFCYQLILKWQSTSQYVEVWSEKEDTVKFRKCAPPSISPSKYKPHKLVT